MSDDNIISASERIKMQQQATSKPAPKPERQPAAVATGASEIAANEANEANQAPAEAETKSPVIVPITESKSVSEQTSMTSISTCVMITLDLTNPTFAENSPELKNALSKYKEDGSEDVNNLYHPFRAVTSKTKAKDPSAARGLLRNALTSVFDVASEIEGQNVMLVGKRVDIVSLLRKAAIALQSRVENALGINPDTIVATVTKTENGVEVPVPVFFRDVVRVSAWANTNGGGMDLTKESFSGLRNAIVVNLTVNSGALYGAEDMDKSLMQIFNYLEQQVEKYENENEFSPNILVGVAVRSSQVADPKIYDLFGGLNENENWELFDRRELLELTQTNEADWMPNTKQAVETALLPTNADLLYISMLMGSDESEEGEET
jgi:hypothetical protein